jgi:VWFA-related protein
VEGQTGRKVLVLFTDGEDSRSELSLPEVMQLLRSSRVSVYPICFPSFAPGSTRAVKSRAVLQQFADLTGGSLFNPSQSRDLAAIYQKILDELGAQYVLGYVSDNQKADGKLRRLVVELSNRKELKVRHRTGYMARPKEENR